MHDHLWFTTSVLPFWFWFWVIVSLVVMFKYKAVGITMLALVIYNLTVWTPSPAWLPQLFTLAVIVAVIGIGWGFYSANGINMMMAYAGALVALVLALILMNGHALGLVAKIDPEGVDVPNVTLTDSEQQLQNDFDDLRAKRVAKENEFERRITRLEAGKSGFKAEISRLRGRVITLQDLLDDHMHEKIGQSHYVDK